jgi:hypothetical protein
VAVFDIGSFNHGPLQWMHSQYTQEAAMLEIICIVGVVVSIAAKIICVQIGCGGSADGKED